jgi:hypothetical protein
MGLICLHCSSYSTTGDLNGLLENSKVRGPKFDENLALIDKSLKVMKGISRIPNIPFSLESDLQSAVIVSERCWQQLKKGITMVRLLSRLESYIKEQNTTKVMLILLQYGNKEELMQKVYSAIKGLERNMEAFKEHLRNVDKVALSPNYNCEDCRGTGVKETQEVFRERGSPPQLIFRTSPCNSCKGTGKKQIRKELKKALDVFSEKMKQIQNTVSDDLELMHNLIKSSSTTVSTLST